MFTGHATYKLFFLLLFPHSIFYYPDDNALVNLDFHLQCSSLVRHTRITVSFVHMQGFTVISCRAHYLFVPRYQEVPDIP